MSTVNFWLNLFLLVTFISQTVVTNGIPAARRKSSEILQPTTPINPTTNILSKSMRPLKKPSTRDPRFLGKFSFVAGLNLPHPPTMSPIHRNDILYKQHKPTQFVTTYNFPPSSWGPFAAAVYEPPPIPSFLEDPLGYIAAILNPYNWFNNSFTTTHGPPTLATIEPDKNQDEVYLLVNDSDNEIPNEERMDKVGMKIGYKNNSKGKYVTKRIPLELSTTMDDFTTEFYDKDSDTDLIAEETTIEPIKRTPVNNNFEDRQFGFGFGRTTTTTTERTKRTEPTTRRTTPVTKPTLTVTRPTLPVTRTIKPPTSQTVPERQTTVSENITIPTQTPNFTNTTSASNDTMGVTTSTTNASQTPYPSNNVMYPNHNHGYYYGGYPQNVSHIELTTSRTQQIAQRIQSLNDVNQYLQPYQPDYHDFDEPPSQQAFDYFRRSEQMPPLPNNYYDRSSNNIFNNMNGNGFNGFKPSFPIHF